MERFFGSYRPMYQDGKPGDSSEESNIVEYRPQLPRRPGKAALAVLYMGSCDGLGLVGFPLQCIDTIRNCILRNWEDGIRREKSDNTGHHFKLEGYPWDGTASDSVNIRRMMRHILKALYELGWKLNFATNISRSSKNKDSLIFRHDPNFRMETPLEWFTVGFSMSSRLRLIDAPEDVIRSIIPTLPNMRDHERHAEYARVHDFDLRGRPFSTTGRFEENVPQAVTLTLYLATLLEDHGCVVYASIKQKDVQGEAEGTGADTWHVYRPANWANTS